MKECSNLVLSLKETICYETLLCFLVCFNFIITSFFSKKIKRKVYTLLKLYLENKNNYDIQARIDVGDCDDINSLLTSGLNEIDLSNANCQDMNQGSSKSIIVIGDIDSHSFTGTIQ